MCKGCIYCYVKKDKKIFCKLDKETYENVNIVVFCSAKE